MGKPESWLDPAYMVTVMASQHVTSLWGVPSPFALVMDASADVLPAALSDLHLSGEALPPQLVRRVCANAGVQFFTNTNDSTTMS